MGENLFVRGLQETSKETRTENNAYAKNTTNSGLIDLFGMGGALRGRELDAKLRLFMAAFAEDPLLSLRMSYYMRDVRGGLGERGTPREIWRYLAQSKPEVMENNMHLIPEYGRWDDMYVFMGTRLEGKAFEIMKTQFEKDMREIRMGGKDISLLGKWLASENASSVDTIARAKATIKAFGLSQREYRKSLSALREVLRVVERDLCAKTYENIDYSRVPSNAMQKYYGAFYRNDEDNFERFLEKVESGEVEINASTLYPYNIIEKYEYSDFDRVLEAQWKAMPEYIEGENNFLVMADTSGSMGGRPMHTSIGLAIYFAERNRGAFKNTFMLFSEKPTFVTLKGDTLLDKLREIPHHNSWNTDIEFAFEEILRISVENQVPAKDMPKSLIIISDMEFDVASADSKMLYMDRFRELYTQAGYEVPQIVFWNVDSRQDVFHVTSEYDNVQLVSGQSASTFKVLIDSLGKDPMDLIVDLLNSERYNQIKI